MLLNSRFSRAADRVAKPGFKESKNHVFNAKDF